MRFFLGIISSKVASFVFYLDNGHPAPVFSVRTAEAFTPTAAVCAVRVTCHQTKVRYSVVGEHPVYVVYLPLAGVCPVEHCVDDPVYPVIPTPNLDHPVATFVRPPGRRASAFNIPPKKYATFEICLKQPV